MVIGSTATAGPLQGVEVHPQGSESMAGGCARRRAQPAAMERQLSQAD